MSIKYVIFIWAQALTIQTYSCQCNPNIGDGFPYDQAECISSYPTLTTFEEPAFIPFSISGTPSHSSFTSTFKLEPASLAASKSGTFTSYSSSPIIPNGIFVTTETALGGLVGVRGKLPFLGTAILKSAVPTIGGGAVKCSCGNGIIDMTTEDIAAYGFLDEISPYAIAVLGPHGLKRSC